MSTMARHGLNLRRTSQVATALAVVLAIAACGPGQDAGAPPTGTQASSTAPSPSSTTPSPSSSTPSTTTTPRQPTTTTSPPKPTAKPTKPAPPVVIVLRPGDNGSKVRSLQARLRQIGWFSGDVSDHYGSRTTEAVKGFQAKRGLAATGVVDETTWNRLLAMTHTPTADELANVKATPKPSGPMRWDVDARCLTGRVMCISKSTRMLTWVIDGVPQYQFAVRFGSDELPTREGVFHVYKKQVDVISNLYHTPMPYSMFFSGGQAVHYSSNFARLGYSGASHGCVNVRDWDGIVRLYNESRIGDAVIIHW